MPTLARIYLHGKPYPGCPDLPWPKQQLQAKLLRQYGKQVEVHAPRYPGICYCGECGQMAIKPDLGIYQNHEFWKCNCNKINYIN